MRELLDWQTFEEDFGPMTIHERIDALIQAQTGEPVKWVTRRRVPIADWLEAVARR
jgi:hypothetical protein